MQVEQLHQEEVLVVLEVTQEVVEEEQEDNYEW
jgi:hypothetical protein